MSHLVFDGEPVLPETSVSVGTAALAVAMVPGRNARGVIEEVRTSLYVPNGNYPTLEDADYAALPVDCFGAIGRVAVVGREEVTYPVAVLLDSDHRNVVGAFVHNRTRWKPAMQAVRTTAQPALLRIGAEGSLEVEAFVQLGVKQVDGTPVDTVSVLLAPSRAPRGPVAGRYFELAPLESLNGAFAGQLQVAETQHLCLVQVVKSEDGGYTAFINHLNGQPDRSGIALV